MAGHTALAGQLGYTAEEIASLDRAGEGAVTDPALLAALEFAHRMAGNAHEVDDALFERMRRHYTDDQILELTCVVGLASYWNRFATALRVDLSGSNRPYDEADDVLR